MCTYIREWNVNGELSVPLQKCQVKYVHTKRQGGFNGELNVNTIETRRVKGELNVYVLRDYVLMAN